MFVYEISLHANMFEKVSVGAWMLPGVQEDKG